MVEWFSSLLQRSPVTRPIKTACVSILSRRVGTLIMAAAVNPEQEKLQQNVALKFKNLEVSRKEYL